MYLGTIQENNHGNGRKPLLTSDNLHRVCAELGIPDDKHTLRRTARAWDLYFSGKVTHIRDHTFTVKSQYDNGRGIPYQVSISKANISYCTCPDWMKNSGDTNYPDVRFHCKHAIAARVWLHRDGNGKRVVNECGTARAKKIQNELNAHNGNGNKPNENGDSSSPSQPYQLDTNNPFEESESLDIAQVQGNGNSDLIHKLSNGEYVVSYNGIMHLADKHGIEFSLDTHEDTHTVIAKARRNGSERISGKPFTCLPRHRQDGSVFTAGELAKRNAARQLLPLPEIKALEKKAKLEAEFDWKIAEGKCLEVVPDFKVGIIIHDLVQAGKLEQKHPSDYNRTEWLMIYKACKKDAETNGGGDEESPSLPEWKVKLDECVRSAKGFRRYEVLKRDLQREGAVSEEHPKEWEDNDFAKLKEANALDKSLFGRSLGHWQVEKEQHEGLFAFFGRYDFGLTPLDDRCYWCEEKKSHHSHCSIKWDRYSFKTILCRDCKPSCEALTEKFDRLYHGKVKYEAFMAECKRAESEVIDDGKTIEANEMPLESSDGKRKLVMDKGKRIKLVEADGTEQQMTIKDVAFTFGSNVVMRLTQGIQLVGADISTVELD